MSITEITNKLDTLGSAWDQFRKVNDARVDEIERKGNADPLFMEQLTKINNVLDGQKSRIDMMETVSNRRFARLKIRVFHLAILSIRMLMKVICAKVQLARWKLMSRNL